MEVNISSNSGIYVHIPYCERKCIYCDFYSITDHSSLNPFITNLLSEIEKTSYTAKDELFDTIYFGGGTPSLLSAANIDIVLKKIYSSYKLKSNSEITVEVNPGTVNSNILKEYKQLGINRLSIGVQSFADSELRFLGRIHNAKQAKETINNARFAGFDNISIDLISALPQQTLNDWQNNLKQALNYSPEHISAYTLIVEEGTPLYQKVAQGEILAQSPDDESAFFEETINFLVKNGYLQYEISSFAKSENFISRHNYKYWNHSNYLGFGPSAHSYWNKRRYKNISAVNDYIRLISGGKPAEVFSEELSEKTIEFEYIFLSLRTFLGVNLVFFKKRFEHDFSKTYRKLITDLIADGFAKMNNEYFKLTQKGMLLSDEILSSF
jgi:oxygen-independent coproporphyrinogen-3 oxidase